MTDTVTIVALGIMGLISLAGVTGLILFARMSFVHAAGERESMADASRTALTYLQASNPMDAVAAEALRKREEKSLEVEADAARVAMDRIAPQVNAVGKTYARDPRTGEEFDIIAGGGM